MTQLLLTQRYQRWIAMHVVILLAVAIASAVSISAESLHAVLLDRVQKYNNAPELVEQLRTVLVASRNQIEKRVATLDHADARELAQHLRVDHSDKGFSSMLQRSKASLELVRRLAESDPILPVLARRTILAYIVFQWILSGQKLLDIQAEQDLAEITSEFYGIHVESVVQKGLVEYLHISKSGGTSFSIAAKLSECTMPGGIGQLDSLDDLPRWINGTAFEEVTGGNTIMWSSFGQMGRQSPFQGCRERLDHILYQGYNYVSNEYTLHGGANNIHKTHVCPQVVNVVTLRHPEARLVSHLHYMLARIKKRLRVKEETDNSLFQQVFCTSNAAVWESVSPAVIDNYVVRSFIGERGFHTPYGDIREDHLAVAQKVLLQFDLVVDLNAGDEAGDLIMAQGLGWKATLSQVHLRESWHSFSKLNYSKEECDIGKLLAKILPHQEQDMQLYSVGRAMAFLDCLYLAMARTLGLQPTSNATSPQPTSIPTSPSTPPSTSIPTSPSTSIALSPSTSIPTSFPTPRTASRCGLLRHINATEVAKAPVAGVPGEAMPA